MKRLPHRWTLGALVLLLAFTWNSRPRLPGPPPLRAGIGKTSDSPSRGPGAREQRLGILPAHSSPTELKPRKVPATVQETPAERQLRSEVVVYLEPDTDPRQFAREYGLEMRRSLRSDPNGFIFFSSGGPSQAAALRERASGDIRVRSAYQNGPARRVRHYVPNDAYYSKPGTPTSAFAGQWHLQNGAAPACNINILPVWGRDVTGAGVVLGIVDDGLETAHPDLAPNYDAAQSYNFGTFTPDPNPVNPDDDHGTAVSGLAAARGGNRAGVTGAAPFATLSCARIDFFLSSDADFADATQYHANAANSTIKVKNHSYGDVSPYQPDTQQLAALAASAQVGTIHLFSAGNGRGMGFGTEDSGRMALTACPDSITVSAVGHGGTYASYSNYGACIFVSAPSYDGQDPTSGFHPFIVTTDRTGSAGYNSIDADPVRFPFPDLSDLNYTAAFGGTSAACPIAAGVLALARQVQPSLDVRLAKHLLVRSSLQVDPSDPSMAGDGDGTTAGSAWRINKAGFHFNQNYGFGLIQADALAQLAQVYSGVTALATESTPPITVNAAIPDNDAAGVTRTFTLAKTTALEEIMVTLSITHPYAGNIRATLTSPMGTTSRLVREDLADSSTDIDWTYTSNAFWGENPAGTWTLRVADVVFQDTGTWNSFSVATRMGTPVAAPFTSLLTGPATSAASPLTYTLMLGQPAAAAPASGSVTVTGGTVTSITADPSAALAGTIYKIVVTPSAPGTVTCQVLAGACTSSVGATPSPATAVVSTLYDNSALTCTVTGPAAINQPSIPFTITFSAAVTPLALSDVTVTNSSNLSLSGSGAVYTATVTPAAQGNVTCSVAAGVVFNHVWTPNAASNTAVSTFDTIRPNTTITSAPPSPSVVGSATFTVTSSEAGSTFKVSLDGAPPLTNATGTVTFTGLVAGTHTVSFWAVDPAGNVDATPAVYSWNIPIVLANTTAPLLNPFDTSFMTSGWSFVASAAPHWGVDATPGSVIGSAPYFDGPASLNYNDGVDDSSGAAASSGRATSNVISLGGLSTARLKFMCNYGLAGPETRTLNILKSDLVTVQQSYVLSSTTDPGLGLCAASGIWHEHAVDVTGLGPSLGLQFAFDTVSAVAPGAPGWFVDDVEISDLLVSALGQLPTGGSVPIPVEGSTPSGSIDFRGVVSVAAGSNAVELDIEVRPLAQPFTGLPTASAIATGAGGGIPTPITVTIPLGPGSYHWRARTISPPLTGTVSNWMEFGLNAATDPDFTIVAPPPPGNGGGGGGGCGATGLEGLVLAIILGRLKRVRRN